MLGNAFSDALAQWTGQHLRHSQHEEFFPIHGRTPPARRLPCNRSSCAMPTSEHDERVYGDVVTSEMAEAQRKISAIALNSTQNGTHDA